MLLLSLLLLTVMLYFSVQFGYKSIVADNVL